MSLYLETNNLCNQTIKIYSRATFVYHLETQMFQIQRQIQFVNKKGNKSYIMYHLQCQFLT